VGGASWSYANAGKGGLILWPLFGATNQLLAGLAFLVVVFYLWRRGKPVWFVVLPMLFMLLMPIWAMLWQCFVGSANAPSWWSQGKGLLVAIGVATVALEIWMIVEAARLFPRVKGVIEEQALDQADAPQPETGVHC
jgi:carbon starvation protein